MSSRYSSRSFANSFSSNSSSFPDIPLVDSERQPTVSYSYKIPVQARFSNSSVTLQKSAQSRDRLCTYEPWSQAEGASIPYLIPDSGLESAGDDGLFYSDLIKRLSSFGPPFAKPNSEGGIDVLTKDDFAFLEAIMDFSTEEPVAHGSALSRKIARWVRQIETSNKVKHA